MVNKANPLSRKRLEDTLVAFDGITTANGAVGATSLIDASLIGANDYITNQCTVLILDGLAASEKGTATAFNPLTGEITFAAMTSQILSGTLYRLINFASPEDLSGVPADITALLADIAGLKSSRDRALFTLDCWGVPQLSVVLPVAAASQSLPDVVVAAIPAGAVVVKAVVMIKFRSISNAGAANKLNGAQHIQIQKGGAGGYADAISLIDDQLTVAAAAVDAPGDVIIGDHNVVAKVTGNDTYNLQWTDAIADVAGLTLNDIQAGLRIWYSV